MTKRRSMSRADVFQLGKLLENNTTPDGEENGIKFVKFNEGWDDQRIADICGIGISSVRTARQDMFGQIRKGGDSPYHKFADRIAALESRVAELEDAITKPRVVKSFADLPPIKTYGTVSAKP